MSQRKDKEPLESNKSVTNGCRAMIRAVYDGDITHGQEKRRA